MTVLKNNFHWLSGCFSRENGVIGLPIHSRILLKAALNYMKINVSFFFFFNCLACGL